MKNSTVFWLCFTSTFGFLALSMLIRDPHWLTAISLAIHATAFTVWLKRGLQESIHRQNLQQLINDMARDLRNEQICIYRIVKDGK